MTEAREEKWINLSPRVRFRSVGDEGVLVHLDSGRVVVVSEVGLSVVQGLSVPNTLDNLAAAIASEFVVTETQAIEDLEVFLAQLDEEKIVEFSNDPKPS
jgi:hypothetical protein